MARILLVEDEDPLRLLLQEVLEGEGHDVMAAPDGRIAEELAEEHEFDLVITDILMPDRDGLETIAGFRRANPSVKIIAMSGGGGQLNQDYLPVAQKFGADKTMAKPFSTRDMVAAVQSLLDGVPA